MERLGLTAGGLLVISLGDTGQVPSLYKDRIDHAAAISDHDTSFVTEDLAVFLEEGGVFAKHLFGSAFVGCWRAHRIC